MDSRKQRLTYLRAKGKLRQALVDAFRGLSKGLLAAETEKTVTMDTSSVTMS